MNSEEGGSKSAGKKQPLTGGYTPPPLDPPLHTEKCQVWHPMCKLIYILINRFK